MAKVQGKPGQKDIDLRKALLKFIGDFSNWDLAANPSYLEVGRGLVKAAHGDEAPLVVDPFAGGGSIPLEALRLGCEAFASDLNPVACLILKVLLEDIPRHGAKVAEELRHADAEIKKRAEKELKQYYPPDQDGATPIAYLWARTVELRIAQLRRGNSAGAIILALQESQPPSGAEVRGEAAKGQTTVCGVRGIYPEKREGSTERNGYSRQKRHVPACERVLAPDRVRAQLTRTARRRGCDLRQRRTAESAVRVCLRWSRLRTTRRVANTGSPLSAIMKRSWKAQKAVAKACKRETAQRA